MEIIAERINSSRKSIASAIESKDKAFIQAEAKRQVAAGADYIDVNAGSFYGQEADKLSWVIEAVQEAVDVPLSIDSPDPKVLKSVLPLVAQPPLINSISLEPSRLEGVLPLVIEFKTKVIGLCQTQSMVADSAEGIFELASQLVAAITSEGITLDRLYIDPLVTPISINVHSARKTLLAIKKIMQGFQGVHTICGITNVSYGLPQRDLLNKSFLIAATSWGLDSAIIDPTDNRMMTALRSILTIMGTDEFCLKYIEAYRAGYLEPQ